MLQRPLRRVVFYFIAWTVSTASTTDQYSSWWTRCTSAIFHEGNFNLVKWLLWQDRKLLWLFQYFIRMVELTSCKIIYVSVTATQDYVVFDERLVLKLVQRLDGTLLKAVGHVFKETCSFTNSTSATTITTTTTIHPAIEWVKRVLLPVVVRGWEITLVKIQVPLGFG